MTTCAPRHWEHDTTTPAGRGYVRLTYAQRVHARESYRSAIRGARYALREARLWRLMSDDAAARRYVDRRANVRHSLAMAAAERRRATLYAWFWQTGLAPAGSAWDARAWDPTTSDSDARVVESFPVRTYVGNHADRFAWACCLSSIGPTCEHQRNLVPFGMAAGSAHLAQLGTPTTGA